MVAPLNHRCLVWSHQRARRAEHCRATTMLLFADWQTTERTVVPAERMGCALGVPMRVLPDR
jgi:hypothetical protein